MIDKMSQKYNEAMEQIYGQINSYFQNIIDAPSTINRIIVYYSYATPEEVMDYRHFIVFVRNNKTNVVKEYNLEDYFPVKKIAKEIEEQVEIELRN